MVLQKFARKQLVPFCVLSLSLGALTGCGQDQDTAQTTYKSTAYVFGTLVDVVVQGVPKEDAQKAVSDLSAGFQSMHDDWHAWKPLGELYKVNEACQTGATVQVSDKTVEALQKAKTYYQGSQTLFNAAIGRVIGVWGFHSDTLPKGYRPPFEEIAELVAQKPSMDDIQIDGNMVSCHNPAAGLDFGGFGKGMALDWALAELKAKGIQNALINAGGDVSTMGLYQNADSAADKDGIDQKKGRPWRIGIHNPKSWGVLATVEAKENEAVYTSGNYERYHDHDGIRYSHIIDPRDGRAMHEIVSTTVIHTNGGLADAAATALTVAGPDHWPEVAKSMGVKFVLLVDEDGKMYASDAMAKRLIFDGKTKPEIKVTEF